MMASFKSDRYEARMGQIKEYLFIMRRYKSTRVSFMIMVVAFVLAFLPLPPCFLVCCRFYKAVGPVFQDCVRGMEIRYKNSLYEVYVRYLPDFISDPTLSSVVRSAVYMIL